MRKAFFPGSFNPFTKGHADIVERGLRLFDSITIGIGYNAEKPRSAETAAKNLSMIKELYAGNDKVDVTLYEGLTVEAARDCGACCILRGVRTCADFEYELAMADVNRRLENIETVLLPARPELMCLSSSIVRELESYGRNIDF